MVFGTPKNMFRFPYFRDEGVGHKAKKISYFLFLIRGGGRRSKQIRNLSLFPYTRYFFGWLPKKKFIEQQDWS